jgi:hypothetical protein
MPLSSMEDLGFDIDTRHLTDQSFSCLSIAFQLPFNRLD